jgi:hypothetical protein
MDRPQDNAPHSRLGLKESFGSIPENAGMKFSFSLTQTKRVCQLATGNKWGTIKKEVPK